MKKSVLFLFVIDIFSLKCLNKGKKKAFIVCVAHNIYELKRTLFIGLKLSKYKKIGTDQTLLQSDPTHIPPSEPKVKEDSKIHKLTKVHERHAW